MKREEDKPVWDTVEYHIQVHTHEKGWKVEIDLPEGIIKGEGPSPSSELSNYAATRYVTWALYHYGIAHKV